MEKVDVIVVIFLKLCTEEVRARIWPKKGDTVFSSHTFVAILSISFLYVAER